MQEVTQDLHRKPESSLRVLLISYEFPPTWTPQSKRWHSIATALAAQGNLEITVLSTNLGIRYVRGQVAEGIRPNYPPNIKVIRTQPGPLAERLYSGDPSVSQIVPESTKKSTTSSLSGLCKRILPLDKSIEWFLSAWSAFKYEIDGNHFDLVITSGPPHATHVWGYAIKKRFGIPWIMDLGDPLTFACDNKAGRITRRCQRYFERVAIRFADQVVVTTEATQAQYGAIFPQYRDKLSVVHQGVDVERYCSLQLTPETGRIAYIGSFYPNVREPFELIKAIAILSGSAKLHITGPLYTPAQMQVATTPSLADSVIFHGFQPEHYCLEQMSRASVLLFIGNHNSTQLPGKLFEYLATGIPVLALLEDPDSDPILPLLQSWPQVIVVRNSALEIANTLKQLFERGPQRSSQSEKTAGLSWRNRAELYRQVIQRATCSTPDELYAVSACGQVGA